MFSHEELDYSVIPFIHYIGEGYVSNHWYVLLRSSFPTIEISGGVGFLACSDKTLDSLRLDQNWVKFYREVTNPFWLRRFIALFADRKRETENIDLEDLWVKPEDNGTPRYGLEVQYRFVSLARDGIYLSEQESASTLFSLVLSLAPGGMQLYVKGSQCVPKVAELRDNQVFFYERSFSSCISIKSLPESLERLNLVMLDVIHTKSMAA